METRIVFFSEIDLAAGLLKEGRPVVFPTETVYGLGAPIWDAPAISKIFSIKGRPADNPLIAHVDSIEKVSTICEDLPAAFFLLAKHFWPGPLAMVLKKKEEVPLVASAGLATLAVRMPDHEIALRLIELVNQPLVAPSANISGRPSPTRAEDAYEDLSGKVDLILDGGNCRVGIESTVISLVQSKPVLLRPGAISQKALEAVLGETLAAADPQGPLLSPGMKYRHYAPKAPIRFVFDRRELRGGFILSPNPQSGEFLLSAKTLYAAFREADRRGALEIFIECDASVMNNPALLNRLEKAACQLHPAMTPS